MFITQSGITFEDFRDELRKSTWNVSLFVCQCQCQWLFVFIFILNAHLHLWVWRNAVNCQMSRPGEMEEKHTANCHFPTTKATTPLHSTLFPPKTGSCHFQWLRDCTACCFLISVERLGSIKHNASPAGKTRPIKSVSPAALVMAPSPPFRSQAPEMPSIPIVFVQSETMPNTRWPLKSVFRTEVIKMVIVSPHPALQPTAATSLVEVTAGELFPRFEWCIDQHYPYAVVAQRSRGLARPQLFSSLVGSW